MKKIEEIDNSKFGADDDQERFIRRSKSIHGDKYEYTKTKFVNSYTKVVITCPDHGDFSVRPSEHYGRLKQGCKVCSGSSFSNGEITTEDFIKKSREVHGEQYDYKKTNYIGSNKNVLITCKIHGDFEVRASDHYGKTRRGCRSCGKGSMNNVGRLTTQSFIKRSRDVHGAKYDYSRSIYKGAASKICIICPVHGEFHMRPSAHYGPQKQGCKSCGNRPDVTTESFVESAISKFGDKFDYSKVVYRKASEKISIVCPIHGEFSITPGGHLNGAGGCKACSGRRDISNEDYLSMLVSAFGDTYDYSKVKYRGQHESITLICRIHGPFQKKARDAISSTGCQECLKFTLEDFIAKATDRHQGKYDYSKVEYISTRAYVTIICPHHGSFEQTPNRHLDGRGCPVCGIESNLLSNRDPGDRCILYYLHLSYKGHSFWKVGITTKSVDTRYKLLKKDGVIIRDSHEVETTIQQAINAENLIIRRYSQFLEYRGHILKNAKGGTECFRADVLSKHKKTLSAFLQ